MAHAGWTMLQTVFFRIFQIVENLSIALPEEGFHHGQIILTGRGSR